MGLIIEIKNIVSPNNFKVFYKQGRTPGSSFEQQSVWTDQYTGGTSVGGVFSGGTTTISIDFETEIDVNPFGKQYWFKILDVVTNSYIIENIYIHDLVFYDELCAIIPTPTPTSTPEPTATPAPTATDVPEPTATGVPESTATPTPTATGVPEPTATDVPEPTATPIPPTPTPVPPTATPVPPTPTVDTISVGISLEGYYGVPTANSIKYTAVFNTTNSGTRTLSAGPDPSCGSGCLSSGTITNAQLGDSAFITISKIEPDQSATDLVSLSLNVSGSGNVVGVNPINISTGNSVINQGWSVTGIDETTSLSVVIYEG
jgi:hypothetical protein